MADKKHSGNHDPTRQSILAQIKDEAQKIREVAHQQGLREGRQQALEEAQAGYAAQVARLKGIADQLPKAFHAGVLQHEDTLVELTFAAVCKILGEHALSLEAVCGMVREAAAQARVGTTMHIYLHPDDLKLLRLGGVELRNEYVGTAVVWEEDRKLALGGCRINGSAGELDARLDTQVQRLRATLLATRARVKAQAEADALAAAEKAAAQ